MTSLNMRSILDANRLTDLNFLDWVQNLRIVLKSENLGYVLEALIPLPPINAPDINRKVHQKHMEDIELATCVMLVSMTPNLQK